MIEIDRSGWRRVRFGDAVTNTKETVKDPVDVGLDRVLALEHMEPGSLRLSGWQDAADGTTFTRRFRPGQTLFAKRRAYQRKVAYAEFDGVCSGDILVLEARSELLLPELLPFIVQSDAFFEHALRTSAGSLSPRTKWQDLATWEFELPPLDEQGRIADLMWALERVHEAVCAELGAISVARNARVREEFDAHPEWPRVALLSVLEEPVRNGISAPATNDSSHVPTISISAIRLGRVAIASSLKYMDVDRGRCVPFELRAGDFLVTRGNGNKQLVGVGGIVEEEPPPGCVYPDLLIRVRVDETRLLREFLPIAWNEPRIHSALLRRAKSTNGIWKVNGKDVSGHLIPVPPLEEQRRILSDLAIFNEAVVALDHSCATAERLSRVLSRELFR